MAGQPAKCTGNNRRTTVKASPKAREQPRCFTMAAAILLFVTLLAPSRILASFRTEGKWNKDIDRDGDGQPEVLRTASNLPVYPGTRCGENFARSSSV